MSKDRDVYAKSMEMEFFLKGILNVKPDSKIDQDLKEFYRSVVFYEDGYVKITPAAHAKRYRRYLDYFERAMDKLAKKNPGATLVVAELREEMPHMSTAADMLYLYERLKPFRK